MTIGSSCATTDVVNRVAAATAVDVKPKLFILIQTDKEYQNVGNSTIQYNGAKFLIPEILGRSGQTEDEVNRKSRSRTKSS